jgi:hypothetical protein
LVTRLAEPPAEKRRYTGLGRPCQAKRISHAGDVDDIPTQRHRSRLRDEHQLLAIFVNVLFGYRCDKSNRWDRMIGLAVLLVLCCFAMMIPNLLVFRVATALVISLGLCPTNQI